MDSIAPNSRRRRRARSRVATALFALLLGLSFGLSLPSVAEAKKKPRYTSARKLGRGTSNLTLGVLALPREVYTTTRDRGPFLGATWGVGKGMAMVVATEVIGLWEVVTCPFQMPRDWKPVMNPEFPWEGFAKDERKKRR